jgi:hypothetical protein
VNETADVQGYYYYNNFTGRVGATVHPGPYPPRYFGWTPYAQRYLGNGWFVTSRGAK